MGFFAFGDLRKENTIKREESLPHGVSIENALTQEGMFYCATYSCHMLERGCIANQKMASGVQPLGKTPLHRELCLN
ncbi:hypothetical protein [Desulforegula conservatrix]|uniref:hypothetical protein n=1 Tax=Desulforegula conservatrix TaxID=153026 RepID=UPI00041293D3|nr:hypothetical protein [Desulforegula conservatrix]